jgi:hypothetical protein
MATYLDGLVSVETRFCQHLRKWGKAGVVKLQTATSPKIYDCGKVCIFVVYNPDHNGNYVSGTLIQKGYI